MPVHRKKNEPMIREGNEAISELSREKKYRIIGHGNQGLMTIGKS